MIRLRQPTLPAVCFSTILVAAAMAQDGPPQFVRDAVDAVMGMLNSDDDAAIEGFIDNAMVPSADRDRAAMIQRLRAVRTAVRGLRDGIGIEPEPDGVRISLAAGDVEKQIRVVISPAGVSDVYVEKTAAPLTLNRDDLNKTVDELESAGMAGVVYVRLGGDVVVKRAFGRANENPAFPTRIDTIFGIGSRPIDFTVAAIHLLAQRGKVGLDDTIDKHFPGVPPDKKSMTIRHLLTGRSGLPDFFHTDDDWDADLAWIDRKTAEQRLLSQQLLFRPGSDERHSHGAFVLLAALVERVTNQSYYGFIRENFLDPAGMSRTGEYGENRGLSVFDFAAGSGRQSVGVPNIPPNWGPTSWLIKGSGGMYSTLDDLLKFYNYVRSDKVLESKYNAPFRGRSVNQDGSDRGFELFSAYRPPDSEAYLFLNDQSDRGKARQVSRALRKLVMSGE